jgi:hypothetical protein
MSIQTAILAKKFIYYYACCGRDIERMFTAKHGDAHMRIAARQKKRLKPIHLMSE